MPASTARRWFERLRQSALAEGLVAVAAARLGERDAVPGPAIPAGFPGRAALVRAGYASLDDLPSPDLDDLDDARAELERVDGIEDTPNPDLDPVDAILRQRGFPAET